MGRGFCPSTYVSRGFTRMLAIVLFIVVFLVIVFSVSVVTAMVVEERLSYLRLEADVVKQESIEPVCEYWKISTLNETTVGSWFRTIGGESTEWAYRLFLYEDNIYVTGITRSFGAGQEDTFIACLSTSNGSLRWFKTIGGYGGDWADDIAVSEDNIYVTGSTGDPFDLQYAFVACLSLDGSPKWFKTIENCSARGITVSEECLYIAGDTPSFEAAETDAFVACLSASNGSLHWFKTIGGSSIDSIHEIAVYGDNICITGNRYLGGLEDPYDVVVACLSLNGSLHWFKTIGGTGHDEAHGIDVSSGNIYITGGTKSFGTGNMDLYVASLGLNGSLHWFKTIGGTDFYFSYDLDVSEDSIYVTGQAEENAFIACLSASDGGLQWLRTIGGADFYSVAGNGVVIYDDHTCITGPVSKTQDHVPDFDVFVAELALHDLSSDDPWVLEWTGGEAWSPVLVDPAEPTETSLMPTTSTHSPTVKIHTPTVTSLTLTTNQQYPETHIAIPEFPSFLVLPVFMMATLLVIIIYRRSCSTQRHTSQ